MVSGAKAAQSVWSWGWSVRLRIAPPVSPLLGTSSSTMRTAAQNVLLVDWVCSFDFIPISDCNKRTMLKYSACLYRLTISHAMIWKFSMISISRYYLQNSISLLASHNKQRLDSLYWKWARSPAVWLLHSCYETEGGSYIMATKHLIHISWL